MSFEAEPLQPGFMVVHGNQLEDLRDLTVEWLKRHPLGPLENETILVQSNGIAQWLKLALAADTREEGGGCGIAAALDMQLPGRFAWQAYRAVLGDGHVPDRSPFDKELVTWRLMRLVPALLDRPEFEPLRRFLRDDSDMRKRHQLAERLADLLDQYQVYRADWLADWADGRDQLSTARGVAKPLEQGQLWQPALWRALLEDMGERDVAASRAFIHGRFMETVAGLSDRPAALPRRVIVFGISSLPRQILDVLGAIARFSQVLLCVHNPCRHYWADIVPEKDLLRAEFRRQAPRPGMPTELTDDNLHQHAHPLLAAWGKQGRDYIRLLDEFDEPEAYRAAFDDRIDLFHTPGQGRILNQLQDDILDLRPLRETRTTWTPVDPREDDSVRFHVAHSPQREVEILHDQLLHRFSQEKDLRPRDVIVMVPDIDTYAPHIRAVFGQLDRDDKRYIPFTISDQSARRQSTVITAVETLLALPDSRFPVSEVLDLVDVPALRERFGIGEDDLATLHRWIEGAGVRWGLHAEQRETLGLPSALEQNSWRFGLRRMLLGYAVGNGDAWKGTQPYDEVGGLEADLAGRLWNFLDALETQWTTLQGSRSPEQWGEVFESLLQRFFVPSGKTDGFTLVQLRQVLRDWVDACARAGFSEELPLTVVRDSWLSAIDTGGLAQRFLAGAVNFCTLMPMRAIPFRMVCLLGMNDGDYPRSQAPLDFDLMAHNYRPGDRSRREDDRYLLLEALLAARVWLHVSWVGRSIRDNTARPPSVLVGQLRDHLEAGWTLAEPAARDDDASLVGALTVKHPLQPFGRAYFDGKDAALFTYSSEWRATHDEVEEASGYQPLAAPEPEAPLTVAALGGFLRDPVKAFFNQRLQVYFDEDTTAAEDVEPFQVAGLEAWQMKNELAQAGAAVGTAVEAPVAVAEGLQRLRRSGVLPMGEGFAAQVTEQLEASATSLLGRYWSVASEYPETVTAHAPLRYSAAGLELEDWLGRLRHGPRGHALIHLQPSNLGELGSSGFKYYHLVRAWVAHLAAHACGQPLFSCVVAPDNVVCFRELDQEHARDRLTGLMRAWRDGMKRPLPLACKTAFAWLAGMEASGEGDAEKKARQEFEGNPPHRTGEGESIYLGRAFANADALIGDADFPRLVDELYRPLFEAASGWLSDDDEPRPSEGKA